MKTLLKQMSLDVLTLQALELIFVALAVKTKRLLEDHLKGGKYDITPTPKSLAEQKSVMKTNVISERDLGMLDRLTMEKPRATTLVLEGIIMFNKNQTCELSLIHNCDIKTQA